MLHKRRPQYIGFFLIAIKNLMKAWRTFFEIKFCKVLNIVKHPYLFKVSQKCEGLIDLNLGVFLFNSVLRARSDSPNIVEVGAYKGLSTIYLSLAASRAGKRLKCFELFSGLPTADSVLDPTFHIGQHSSTIGEYEANLKAYGRRDVVDLVIGDATQTMLPTIKDGGFCMAFIDVDVYSVTRELLFQLWSMVKGGEVIIIHDANSPGVRKAIDKFHALFVTPAIESTPVPLGEEGGLTIKLDIPLLDKMDKKKGAKQ